MQRLISGWRGPESGHPVGDLHHACVRAAGPGGRSLLPAHLITVDDLDTTTLQQTIRGIRGGAGVEVRFRVQSAGSFDSALVPIMGPEGEYDRWLLAISSALPAEDQVALYGHAVGHLLLNRDVQKMGQLAPLDPKSGRAHADTLSELRLLESIRQPLDRRVLEAFPLLTALIRSHEETVPAFDTSTADLRQQWGQAGWRGQFIQSPYIFTDGRVIVSGTAMRRGGRLRLDALLRLEASLPIAAVQTVRSGEARAEAEQRLIEYVHVRLRLPFAYLVEENGAVEEWDWSAGGEVVRKSRTELPQREELRQRWLGALRLGDEKAQQALAFPYQAAGHRPRYYQEAAINRAAVAVLQARRQLRKPRVLLTLATGTGKTKVAFQLVWKLKRSREVRKVLFLADRDYLVGQAMDNEFAPFGDARHRISGTAATSRDIYFATYQALAGDEKRIGLYKQYPRKFFDLIIVDECHRGSASEESNWRSILEHFDGAVQVGMTATPLRSDNEETYTYFDAPVYTYSLRAGINDGFLAPYRVRRILLGTDEQPSSKAPGTTASTNEKQPPADSVGVEETPQRLRDHTDIIAEHLARYLERTDPLAKTIVFCVDQDHAQQMCEALEHECRPMVDRYPNYVERIVADEGMDGKRALGRFSTPDQRTPVIVTTSRLLSTGVDVPTCKNIVLVRPIGSMVEFKQIIGRGTRLLPPDKTWFTILDYAGATQLFFDPSFDGDPELIEVEPLIPVQPTGDRASDATSPPSGDANQGDLTVTGVAPQDSAPPSEQLHPTEPDGEPDGRPVTGDRNDTAMPEELQAEDQVTTVHDEDQVTAVHDESTAAVTPSQRDGDMPGNEQDTSTNDAVQPPVTGDVVDTTDESSADEGNPANEPAQYTTAEGKKHGGIREDETTGDSEGHRPPVLIDPITAKPTTDGRLIKVIGEIVYELGPDGSTLRTVSFSDYTKAALQGMVTTPTELIARWLRPEQREEILTRLAEEGIDWEVMATSLRMPDADPFDLLLHIAFGLTPMTRRGRAEKLRREHGLFFQQYTPAARAILDTILEKYIDGEAPDVSDTQLLRIPPLSERGSFMELVQPFGGGQFLRNALKEMHKLLYRA